MYYDEIQGHHRDGEQVLKTMIQHIMQEVKEYRHLYLKRVIQTLPETCSTPSDYLFLANVFAATQERLYSKVKQISQEEHTWITPEMKEKCMKRLHDNLGHEFVRDEEGASVVTKKWTLNTRLFTIRTTNSTNSLTPVSSLSFKTKKYSVSVAAWTFSLKRQFGN